MTLVPAPLVPELLVSSLAKSLAFWCGLLGFRLAYDRPEEGFAYLDLGGAQVMLEERNPAHRQWVTGPLESPLGRGINFQVEVPDVAETRQVLRQAGYPVFMELKSYRVGGRDVRQRQFLVQDPDGHLIRLASSAGPIEMTDRS